jgi:hypothetical protein
VSKKAVRGVIAGAVLFAGLAVRGPSAGIAGEPGQEVPGQKPKYDYMSTFLSRSTQPLGLKEDLISRRLLRQPAVKWALRAGVRQILN